MATVEEYRDHILPKRNLIKEVGRAHWAKEFIPVGGLFTLEDAYNALGPAEREKLKAEVDRNAELINQLEAKIGDTGIKPGKVALEALKHSGLFSKSAPKSKEQLEAEKKLEQGQKQDQGPKKKF